jgi:hypothetical protein
MNESRRRVLFAVLCAVVWFQTGAHISQSFVNYPAWRFIDSASFPDYHRVMTVGAIRYLLVPRVVELVLTIVVLRFRPATIAPWMLVLGIGLTLGGLLTTSFVQYPIHAQLETIGNTPELLSRLRTTDWIRHAQEIPKAALYLWMLSLIVTSGTSSTRSSGA